MKIHAPLDTNLSALQNLWQEAFGDTEEFLNSFFRTAFDVSHCRCVTVNGTITAALYWFDCSYQEKQIAYIYAVATSKAFRGQGICHKLMEDTHHYLKETGYQGALLVPGSKELFHFYNTIGYQTCCQIHEFHCTAAKTTCSLRQIDKNAYAKLRRHFLPESGVIQEKKNLDFLQTQAKFYAGSDFVLACHGEGNTLYGIELLGNDNAASEIVHTLGYSEGNFRIPGNGKPFAMYYPLEENTPSPSYFGLAFD